MKRYLSMGSAMMLGVVATQAKNTYDFQLQEKPTSAITGMHVPTEAELAEFNLNFPDASIIPALEKIANGVSVDSSVSAAEAKILKQASNEDPNIPIDPKNNGYYNGLDWLLMVPQKPTEIQCGRRMLIVANWQFQCYDYVEKVYWNCLGRTDNHYACWDGAEWEWPNYHE